MTVSILDLHCLNAVCDDYEDVSSITNEVRRSTHGKLTSNEIGRCLIELARQGLVEIFEFDSSQSKYVSVSGWVDDWNGKWFFITSKGRAELESNWVEA